MSVQPASTVTTLREAHRFLAHFPHEHYTLVNVVRDLLKRKDTLTVSVVRREVVKVWWAIMRSVHSTIQGDSDFQLKLTVAVENHILSRIHDRLFAELCDEFIVEDSHFERHCQNLSAAGVSGEDFSIPEGYSIDLMSAVVELAALDSFTCPLEKFNCLNETLTLMAAELKAAIADTYWAANGNMTMMDVTTKDMEPFLCTVLVRAKPLHLATNLYYLRHFQNTVSPLDSSWATLLTFEQAHAHVLKVDPQEVASRQQLRRSTKRAIGLEEVLQWSCSLDSNPSTLSLRDRQMEQVLYMVKESTLNGCLSGLDQLATEYDDDDHDYENHHYAETLSAYQS